MGALWFTQQEVNEEKISICSTFTIVIQYLTSNVPTIVAKLAHSRFVTHLAEKWTEFMALVVQRFPAAKRS